MKLTVTDACVFIELDNLFLTSVFFKLDIEVHTSIDVFNELYPRQQELLTAYQTGGKLCLHNLEAAERVSINSEKYPSGLSQNDKTVLFLAKTLQAMILSTDKLVRKHAQKTAIECHGMLWLFDQLVDAELLALPEACVKLRQMIAGNLIYQNNIELLKEAGARLAVWEKK